jgi:hypothetical protein
MSAQNPFEAILAIFNIVQLYTQLSTRDIGLLKHYSEVSKKSKGIAKLTGKGNYITWSKRI